MAVSQNDLQKMNDVLGRLGAGESAVSIVNGDKTLSLENTGNGLQVGASLVSALNVCKVAISNVGAAGAVLVFTSDVNKLIDEYSRNKTVSYATAKAVAADFSGLVQAGLLTAVGIAVGAGLTTVTVAGITMTTATALSIAAMAGVLAVSLGAAGLISQDTLNSLSNAKNLFSGMKTFINGTGGISVSPATVAIKSTNLTNREVDITIAGVTQAYNLNKYTDLVALEKLINNSPNYTLQDWTIPHVTITGTDTTSIRNAVTEAYANDTAATRQLFSGTTTIAAPSWAPASGTTYDGKKAFYETNTKVDNSLSIADKTGVLLDANKRSLTAAALAALDANKDGKLTGSELNGLQIWADTNENGLQDAGELRSLAQQGIGTIRAADYGFYTRGNAVSGVAGTAPVNVAETVGQPTRPTLTQSVPASNYRSLRDTDNRYWINGSSYIDWGSNQVKINNAKRDTLIGTDGNDSFDANYYAAYGQYFNNNLLVNFMAGGGDDTVGGSSRNDSIWGGTGNDVVFGYDGDDKLYGEEGNDQLQGGAGADFLDGGIGNDNIFGQVGNDILNGGDGDDWLMGFTATNEAKQTLLAGETDDDIIFGGNGNDQIYGGLGNDQLDGGEGNDNINGGQGDDKAFGGNGADMLNGNEGNDQLLGDGGNDTIWGGVGDDRIWGGDGDDVLIGFTPSNDSKQTLAAGESDNDTIYGGAGNDQIYGGLGNDTLDGGIGTDTIKGGDGNDLVFGGDGDDELSGEAGNDTLSGDAGVDKLFGGVGNDTLYGGDGDDLLMGFTAVNDTKQSLSAGETDDDILYGGNGNDGILGGLGNDQLYGDAGNDELQGGDGNDQLYGGDGNDRLFGQTGDDVIYGGSGDDLIYGFTATNETKQTLNAGETDNDWLYGGDGADTIVGGLGNDYIDGGAGADNMQGGLGDDTYIVNSVNDVILEQQNEGYDTVISSANYMLNANIEELRLLEGFDINGTGNSLNNLITGNSRDNILDGVTGADTMIGGLGNDTYVVDNGGDQVVEYANEGIDTVQSKISYTLGDNLESLTLLDFSNPEQGLVNGTRILVYGYPKANELDYMQGNAVAGYKGTCALTSIANIAMQAGVALTEAQVVQTAISNNWCVTDASKTDYDRGCSNYLNQQALLTSYGIRNDIIQGYNEQAIANLIKSGRGVMIAVNAGKLWGGNTNANYDFGVVDHVITVTGVAYDATTGALNGFYIADSGRGLVSDMSRYVSATDFKAAACVGLAYTIYTLDPTKLWEENINATGNALDNNITGNRGNNILFGGAGTDTLTGGLGNDTYLMQRGQGNDIIVDTDTTIGNNDIISLASDITSDQLWFSHVGNDLKISVIGTSDSYTVKNWYSGSSNQVEQFKAANGKALSNTNVEKLVQAMSGLSAPVAGTTSLPTNYQNTLNPVIAANWQ